RARHRDARRRAARGRHLAGRGPVPGRRVAGTRGADGRRVARARRGPAPRRGTARGLAPGGWDLGAARRDAQNTDRLARAALRRRNPGEEERMTATRLVLAATTLSLAACAIEPQPADLALTG